MKNGSIYHRFLFHYRSITDNRYSKIEIASSISIKNCSAAAKKNLSAAVRSRCCLFRNSTCEGTFLCGLKRRKPSTGRGASSQDSPSRRRSIDDQLRPDPSCAARRRRRQPSSARRFHLLRDGPSLP